MKLLLIGEEDREQERNALYEKARSVGPRDDREAWLRNTREIAGLLSEHADVSAEISRLVGELAPPEGSHSPLDDEDYEDLRERLGRALPADGPAVEREAWEEIARCFDKKAERLGGVAAYARETIRLCPPAEEARRTERRPPA